MPSKTGAISSCGAAASHAVGLDRPHVDPRAHGPTCAVFVPCPKRGEALDVTVPQAPTTRTEQPCATDRRRAGWHAGTPRQCEEFRGGPLQ